MAWVPRDTAPASFSLAAAFRALVTGVAEYAWTDQFLPLIGAETFDTTAFCLAGPPSVGFTLDPSDFINMTPRTVGRLPLLIGAAAIDQVRILAQDRVFGAYCKNSDASIEVWSETHCLSVHSTGYTEAYFTLPPSTSSIRFRVSSYTPGPGGVAQNSGIYLSPTEPISTFTLIGELPALAGSIGVTQTASIPAGSTVVMCNCIGGIDATWCFETFGLPGISEDHTVTPPTPPAGLVSRTPTAATLEAMAAELDAQETKLDFLTAGMQYLTRALDIPTEPDPTVIDAPPGVTLNVENAAGCIVFLDLIRAGANEHFGTPPTYTKLGEVVFSGHGGVGPVIELRTNPQLVFPMPPGSQGMTVKALPPAHATVKLIPKLK